MQVEVSKRAQRQWLRILTYYYLVSKVDYAQHNSDNKEDANEFVPEVF